MQHHIIFDWLIFNRINSIIYYHIYLWNMNYNHFIVQLLNEEFWEPFPDDCFCVQQMKVGMTIIIDMKAYVFLCSTNDIIYVQVLQDDGKDYVKAFPIDCGWLPVITEFQHSIRPRCHDEIFKELGTAKKPIKDCPLVITGIAEHYKFANITNNMVTFLDGNYKKRQRLQRHTFWYI